MAMPLTMLMSVIVVVVLMSRTHGDIEAYGE